MMSHKVVSNMLSEEGLLAPAGGEEIVEEVKRGKVKQHHSIRTVPQENCHRNSDNMHELKIESPKHCICSPTAQA